MGNSYYVYTEIKLNGKWKCVNQSLKIKDKWRMIPTYESHSRSYFESTYYKLQEIGRNTPDDLSEEVLIDHPLRKDPDDRVQEYYNGCVVATPISSIESLVNNKEKQYHGFYHKDRIYEFEHGDRDDLYECDVDPEKFAKLPAEIRNSCYSYYEWDNPMDWNYHFKKILNKSRELIYEYKDYNSLWFEEPEARIVCVLY